LPALARGWDEHAATVAVKTNGQKPIVKLLHKILAVAQKAAKSAQNTSFSCGTLCRMLLICIRREYYLSNFKTAAFSHSAAPPDG
jgi:translation initiation factor 2B subunit (eIF-2B alpha/beta/delta family)